LIDQTAGAASGIGRENMAFNMLNQNPAYAYMLLQNGVPVYKGSGYKCGGMLKRYKK
jgi:hypothetical protein